MYDGLVIEPAPQINITKTPIYVGADQNMIGYTYQVNLNGHASSNLLSDPQAPRMSNSVYRVDQIKNILHRNGKQLSLWDNCNNKQFILGLGGKLTSFDTQSGDWYNYIQYTATLEFNELFIYGESVSTSIALNTVSVQDPVLYNRMLKIKTYDDNWNFTIPEEEAYRYYSRLANVDSVGDGSIAYSAEDYTQINVSYTINATGKHYYGIDNTTKAAWEAAKDFVQYKLYHQIAMFRNGYPLSETNFANTSYNSNEYGNQMNQAITSNVQFQQIPVVPPILDKSIADRYAIYNETIDCSTSETAGTFTATYNCVLKRYDPYIASPQNSIHTFQMSYNQERSFRHINRTLSLTGSVQGLLLTNILDTFNDGQSFYLPMQGVFYGVSSDTVSKYGNAYQDFVTYIINEQQDDVQDGFKYVLGINYSNLFPGSDPDLPCVRDQGYQFLYQILAKPKNLNVNHNYGNGSIEYSATYDTERACAQERGFQTMTITEDDSLPLYSEHTVIGRQRGALIQDLNTNKNKEITIAFQGVTNKTCASGNPFSIRPSDLSDPNFTGLHPDVCDTDTYLSFPTTVEMIYFQTEREADLRGRPLITKSYTRTYNPADGSFNVSKTYLVTPDPPTNDVCVEEEE